MPRLWHTLYIVAIAVLLAVVFRRAFTARSVPDLAERFQDALIERTDNFGHVEWLGHPVWQSVMDLWTLQETLADLRPVLVIECGTYKGGSALFMAHLFDLMNHGRVITVDIEKFHDLSHPRITFLIGDCASPKVVQQVRAAADSAGGPVMVMLDSDHSAAHVAKELRAYAPLVTPGSFLHVQDGVIDLQPRFVNARPGPLRAIQDSLPSHPEFQVDQARSDRFLITHHPKGWLRRTTTRATRVSAAGIGQGAMETAHLRTK